MCRALEMNPPPHPIAITPLGLTFDLAVQRAGKAPEPHFLRLRRLKESFFKDKKVKRFDAAAAAAAGEQTTIPTAKTAPNNFSDAASDSERACRSQHAEDRRRCSIMGCCLIPAPRRTSAGISTTLNYANLQQTTKFRDFIFRL